jgi:hypothetical protein
VHSSEIKSLLLFLNDADEQRCYVAITFTNMQISRRLEGNFFHLDFCRDIIFTLRIVNLKSGRRCRYRDVFRNRPYFLPSVLTRPAWSATICAVPTSDLCLSLISAAYHCYLRTFHELG